MNEIGPNNIHKNKVHKILAYSYLTYFLAFLLGLFFDFLFPYQLFSHLSLILVGLIFLLIGTILIFWAQKTSRHLNKENLNKETFAQGPYRYTRSPTHLGIFFLLFGFGIMTGTMAVIFCTVLAFLITKFVFLRRQEKILSQKYGSAYEEYKKSVKF